MSRPEEYFAVVFTSRRSVAEGDAYTAMAGRMEELAAVQKGFLGMESARSADGVGITVSYWEDEASIREWKRNAEHMEAQRLGRERWYEGYSLKIAKVVREYHHGAERGGV